MHLGSYNTTGTRTHVGFQFTTSAGAGGLVAPSSAFEAADLKIYRAADGAAFSGTERSSAAGITMTSPFDAIVGLHDVDIDLTDNTDAGFYAAGYRYSVILLPDETVDGQTVGKVVAMFEIGPPPTNIVQVNGASGGVARLERAMRAITIGTVGVGSTVTSIVTSSLDPAAAVQDQFKGLILAFDKDTTTGALRGQKTDITASTTGGVLTVTSLTTSPASGDTFTIE